MESFELRGMWWLPGAEKAEVAGSLKYSNDRGLRLELFGTLAPINSWGISSDIKIPIVVGRTEDGGITLHECQLVPGKTNVGWFASQTITAKVAYKSHRGVFELPEELSFTAIDLYLSHLPDWVHISGTNIRIAHDKSTGTIIERVIRHADPAPLVVSTPHGVVTLSVRAKEPMPSRNVAIREFVWISVTTSKSQALEWWMRTFVAPLQDLLTFATDEPNEISHLTVYTPELQEEAPYGMSPVKVLFRGQYVSADSESAKWVSEDSMIFPLREIEDRFGDVILSWLSNATIFEEVWARYFGTRYRDYIYPLDEFANLVQAVEGWSRASSESSPSEGHVTRVEEILESIPARYKRWLKGKLRHSHEPSLEQRLRTAVASVGPKIDALYSDRNDFVVRISQIRNDMAHAKPNTNRPHMLEVIALNDQLTVLLQMLLLRELGLPVEFAMRTVRFHRARLRARSSAIVTPYEPDDIA